MRKRNLFGQTFNNIYFLLNASMARRRFWMINNLFPKSPDGYSLINAIKNADKTNLKTLDLGCGDRAQSLRDLQNQGFDNLIGLDIKPPKKNIKRIRVIKSDICNTSLEDNSIDGVVYSSYVLAHLPVDKQFVALNEINRISAVGSQGYIGPFNPQVFSKIDKNSLGELGKFKNPFFGFVKLMNETGNGKWQLHRSLLTNMATYSKTNFLQKLLYSLPIPFFMAYVLTGRAVLNRIVPTQKINKDFYERFPFEYYITFSK